MQTFFSLKNSRSFIAPDYQTLTFTNHYCTAAVASAAAAAADNSLLPYFHRFSAPPHRWAVNRPSPQTPSPPPPPHDHQENVGHHYQHYYQRRTYFR